jgi:hypothetical protein
MFDSEPTPPGAPATFHSSPNFCDSQRHVGESRPDSRHGNEAKPVENDA